MRITETDHSLPARARVAEAGAQCEAKRSVDSEPHRLALDEVRALLGSFPSEMVTSLDALLCNRCAGVGLRVDLSYPFRPVARELATLLESRGLPALWLVEPLGSGLGYCREGRFVADLSALHELAGHIREKRIGLLARPGLAFAHAVTSPNRLWLDACDAMRAAGFRVEGIGMPFGTDPSSLLSGLWLYRAAGKLRLDGCLRELEGIPLQSFEWLYERLDPVFCPLLDATEAFAVCLEPGATSCYVGDFLVSLSLAMHRRLSLEVDGLIHSTPTGWLWIACDGAETLLDTGETVRCLAASADKRIAVVIDVAHLATEPREASGFSPARTLPWPFDYWLALASDVDWTTHEHLERQAEELCDRLGLPFSTSAYLLSHSRLWPAWTPRDGAEENLLARWCAEGVLDTVHGLVHSFDPVTIARNLYVTAPTRVMLDAARRDDSGVLIELGNAGNDLLLEWETASGGFEPARLVAVHRDTEGGSVCLVVRFGSATRPRALRLAPLTTPVRVERILALYAGTEEFTRACEALGATDAGPLLFTAHGGGAEVNSWGQLRSSYGLTIYPEHRSFALDRPASPFSALPALRAAGIRFFNPLDLLFHHATDPIDRLVEPRMAQDGEMFYVFRRYLHSDPPERGASLAWTFAKHAATAQALPAVLAELLRRLQRAERGHGAIVYTHLGNRVGDELVPRLGWTEELHAGLAVATEHYHMRDRERQRPFRLWITTPASALAYAALMRGISNHVEVHGSIVRIHSWHDDSLGHAIPDVTRFGGAWLHGLTVYVDDPAAARILVDNMDYPDYTANPLDETGRLSVTLVDSRRAIGLVPAGDPMRLNCEDTSSPVEARVRVTPQSLRNITHWRFEARATGSPLWSIGFETSASLAFLAGTEPGVAWRLKASSDCEMRYVLPLFDCAEPHRPAGRVEALRIRVATCGSLEVRSIDLLRPLPGRPLGDQCKVSLAY